MTCHSCLDADRRGYCAPLRCYCGHEACYAFASWQPLARPFGNVQAITRPRSTAWAYREESTWIDKL